MLQSCKLRTDPFSRDKVNEIREEFYALQTQVDQGEFILRNVDFKEKGEGICFHAIQVCNNAVVKILGIGKARLQRLREKRHANRKSRQGMAFKTTDENQPSGFRHWAFTKTQHVLAFLNTLACQFDIQPDRHEVHLPYAYKKEAWEEYKRMAASGMLHKLKVISF